MIHLILCFMIGFFISSYLESFYHDRLAHRKSIINHPLFKNTRVSHEIIHHLKTFKKNHVTQFSSEDHKKDVDNYLELKYPEIAQTVKEENYGTTPITSSSILFILPFLFLIPFIKIKTILILFIPSIIPMILSVKIHKYMHMSYEKAMNEASPLIKLILQTSYIRKVWRHHWMHHKYMKYNFNLLLFGGDWIRGCYKNPSEHDIK
jgi:hypothetical protein